MTIHSILACALIISSGLAGDALGAPPKESTTVKPPPPVPLSLAETLAQVDRSHPLLQGASTERLAAKGRFLRAMGAFEPAVVNDLQLERFIDQPDPETQTGGFNDTFLEVRHPSGIGGIAGIRQSIGDAVIPDLGFNDDQQQLLLGVFLPLLRGFLVNPEKAELERSQLADPRAEVQIALTRQDLFRAAASQYWDWLAAWKVVGVQGRALAVATERMEQIRRRAKAGAAAPLDVTEAEQEVQRRREILITAQRKFEREAFKLSLFLWEHDQPVVPGGERVPRFPRAVPPPSWEEATSDRRKARSDRPEVRAVRLEAELNNIDLRLAKNNLLPRLDAEAEPARNPEKFVLGLGYRFGVTLSFPFLQREARGEVLKANAKAQRLAFTLRFREEQVATDVDDALSALRTARDRIQASAKSLRLAQTLLKGEQSRLKLGATSVLFVNLRERNAVDAEAILIRARADYEKAWAFYRWATGSWALGAMARKGDSGSLQARRVLRSNER